MAIRPLLIAAAILPFLAPSPALAGDAAKGAALFKAKCGACHAAEAGKNKIGPSLFGVVGRPSGSVAGFKYSPANKAAGLTWDTATLDKYLVDPKAFVPGTIMTFPGLKDADERADVIAYLETLK
jgi:cytochrome c